MSMMYKTVHIMLSDKSKGRKVSLRCPSIFPKIVWPKIIVSDIIIIIIN